MQRAILSTKVIQTRNLHLDLQPWSKELELCQVPWIPGTVLLKLLYYSLKNIQLSYLTIVPYIDATLQDRTINIEPPTILPPIIDHHANTGTIYKTLASNIN